MEWFEYLIIIAAIIIVLIPIFQSIKNYKRGQSRCSNDCSLCHDKRACENIRNTLESIKKEKE